MNKLLIIFALFFCSPIYAAEWVFATKTKQENYYVDKSYYKYLKNGGLAEIWWKSEIIADEPYTTSKALLGGDGAFIFYS